MLICANEVAREEKTRPVRGAQKIRVKTEPTSAGVPLHGRDEGHLGPPVDFSEWKGFRVFLERAALMALSLPVLLGELSV